MPRRPTFQRPCPLCNISSQALVVSLNSYRKGTFGGRLLHAPSVVLISLSVIRRTAPSRIRLDGNAQPRPDEIGRLLELDGSVGV